MRKEIHTSWVSSESSFWLGRSTKLTKAERQGQRAYAPCTARTRKQAKKRTKHIHMYRTVVRARFAYHQQITDTEAFLGRLFSVGPISVLGNKRGGFYQLWSAQGQGSRKVPSKCFHYSRTAQNIRSPIMICTGGNESVNYAFQRHSRSWLTGKLT